MRKLYLILALFYFANNIEAQNKTYIDSLLKVNSTSISDSNIVFNYNLIAYEYAESSPQKSDSFAELALELSLKINNFKGIGRCYYILGYNLLLQGNYNASLENLYRSEEAYLKVKDSKGLATVYSQIGNVYLYNENFDKAIEYQKKALVIQIAINDKVGLASTYNNIGVCFYNKKNFDQAIINIKESARIKFELNDERSLANAYNNIAGIYVEQNKFAEALSYCSKALEIYEKNNDIVSIAFININIGDLYIRLNNYKTALRYYHEGLKFSKEANSLISIRNAYKGISVTYDSIGDYKNAYKNRLEYELIDDSIYSIKQSETFAEMQTKFETKEKERKIVLLEKENELKESKIRQTRIITFGISALVILLLISIISLINIRRQKRNRREIISRIIETEEKERGHFAEELHDGLGPLLSSINLYVDVISSEKTDAQKKTKLISDVGELIQDAITTTKTIANNLTPATLKDFGLTQAIEAFCRKANSLEKLQISIDDKTSKKRYHSIIETTLYRVALEMINNTFKYAEADKLNIAVYEKNNVLYYEYSDNGNGFNLEQMLKNTDKGQGLNNMINRTQSINGTCELKSSIGKGFSASIEIPLKYLDFPS